MNTNLEEVQKVENELLLMNEKNKDLETRNATCMMVIELEEALEKYEAMETEM